ncbi:Aquaporin TIP4-1 [Bienertia sinuspersici]
MRKIALGTSREATQPDCINALVVEFICTFLFVFTGVGSAMAAATMIAAGFNVSGGHLNPAVTLGLAVGGHITLFRSLLYWIIQCLASALACFLLNYVTSGMITPIHSLAKGVDPLQGLVMEVILTFSLLFTIYTTIVDPKKGPLQNQGILLTGLVVGANIFAGGLFSGASMNPARSFGPALVSWNWTDHWVYWVGPLIGGALAGLICDNFFIVKSHALLSRDDESF